MESSTSPVENHEDVLAWSVDLGREYPEKRRVVLIAAAIGGLVGALWLRAPLAFPVGFAAVVLGNAELVLPIQYRLDSQGVRRKIGLSDSEMAWDEVKRLIPFENGVRLSPFRKSSRLDAFRGIPLRFSSNQDAVLAKIRALTELDGRTLDGKPDPGGRESTGGEDRSGNQTEET